MGSTILLLAAASDSGLTKHGTLVSREAKAHIFGVKPNQRCRPDVISMITGNSSSDRTSALPGIICNYGLRFMKHASKSQMSETRTLWRITSKPNINLRRSFLALFVG